MHEPESIHLPGPSPWPPILGLGTLILGAGIALASLPVLLVGLLVTLAGLLGWMYEEIQEARGD